jgi:predicted RNA-binding Zn ribbon-like protein
VNEKHVAPGALETVRALVNTHDLESDSDELASPAALIAWLAEHNLTDASAAAEPEDLLRAREVREALRTLLLANSGHDLDPDAPTVLDAAARRAGLLAGFGPDGGARLEPTASGVDAALGRVLACVHGAMADGTWHRLKACGDPGCQWAFYDSSKNRSGVWCSMAVCGNRSKARSYRERRARA